jgi:hypothetical protein
MGKNYPYEEQLLMWKFKKQVIVFKSLGFGGIIY